MSCDNPSTLATAERTGSGWIAPFLAPPRTWLLLLGPLLALTLALSLGYLWNEDFWWYLGSGRAILAEGGIPSDDPFLYTSGDGIGWVYHSWLWTVIVAALESLGGLDLVVLFHGLLAATLVVLLFTTARTDRLGLINALLVILVLATLRHRVCGKAEIVTWLMLVIFYRLLERPGPFPWHRVAALGGLEILWANLHGGYPLGVFLALSYSVGGWVQDRWRLSHRGAERSWPPLWLPVLLFLLALADPTLFRERLAPFGFVLGSETVQPLGDAGGLLILEWRSPFDGSLTDPSLPWLFALAVAVGLLSFRRARHWHLPRLLFLLGMATLGATAVRHLGGLSIAAALVALSNLADRRTETKLVEKAGKIRKPRRRKRPQRPPRPRRTGRATAGWLYPAACAAVALGLLGATVGLLLVRSGFDGGQKKAFFVTKPTISAPGAVEYLLRHRPPGPVFNDYPLGGYLGTRLQPAYRVFVDSRVLDPSVVARYTRMVQSPAEWRRAEAEYGFRVAVLGTFSQTVRSPLGRTLLEDPRWRLAYLDPLAVVFLKDAPGVEIEVRPWAGSRDGSAGTGRSEGGRVPFVGPPPLLPPVAFLQRLFLNDYPSNYLIEYLAMLGQLQRPELVRELATRALETMPGHPLILRQRCAAHWVERQVQRALDDCSTAYGSRPEDGQIAALYALVLEGAGQRRRAAAVVETALDRNPGDRSLEGLARRLSSP